MASLIQDFEKYDALGLAELVRQKEVKPIEIVETVIDRIERVNPVLNFMATKTYDLARKLAEGPLPEGVFAGIPLLLKDISLMYAGVRTTSGAAYYKDFVPKEDSFIVQLMKKAGMILVGKSTTAEMGTNISTETPFFGATLNPWDLNRVAGGSSGGAAAAVAARVLPIANANDGGGSTRIPASNCGLVGLKQSRGRVSIAPQGDHVYGLACVSCVSLTVRDTAAFLDVISEPVPGDPYQMARPKVPFLEQINLKPNRLKIGFTANNPFGGEIDPDCFKALENTVKLCNELGHDVAEMNFTFDGPKMFDTISSIMSVLFAMGFKRSEKIVGRAPTKSDFLLSNWSIPAEQGRQVSGIQHAMDIEALRIYGRQIATDCEPYDIVLTPTMPKPPQKIGSFDQSMMDMREFWALHKTHIGFTQPINVSGQPAISLPLHWTKDNIPIGVQLIGRFGQEATVLKLSSQLEKVKPWIDKKPPVCA